MIDLDPIPLKVLVTGGRFYTNQHHVWTVLFWYNRLYVSSTLTPYTAIQIIEGGATGADKSARKWAEKYYPDLLQTEPADWTKYGRAAGPIRNKLMLDKYQPNVVIAFPGNDGTNGMVELATKAGIYVDDHRSGK